MSKKVTLVKGVVLYRVNPPGPLHCPLSADSEHCTICCAWFDIQRYGPDNDKRSYAVCGPRDDDGTITLGVLVEEKPNKENSNGESKQPDGDE